MIHGVDASVVDNIGEIKNVRRGCFDARTIAPFTAARDLTIRVGTGAKAREYDLIAEATLYEPRTNKSRQFWFGMLVRWSWS